MPCDRHHVHISVVGWMNSGCQLDLRVTPHSTTGGVVGGLAPISPSGTADPISPSLFGDRTARRIRHCHRTIAFSQLGSNSMQHDPWLCNALSHFCSPTKARHGLGFKLGTCPARDLKKHIVSPMPAPECRSRASPRASFRSTNLSEVSSPELSLKMGKVHVHSQCFSVRLVVGDEAAPHSLLSSFSQSKCSACSGI